MDGTVTRGIYSCTGWEVEISYLGIKYDFPQRYLSHECNKMYFFQLKKKKKNQWVESFKELKNLVSFSLKLQISPNLDDSYCCFLPYEKC